VHADDREIAKRYPLVLLAAFARELASFGVAGFYRKKEKITS